MGLFLRVVAGDVDDAARLGNAIEYGGGAFEHFYARHIVELPRAGGVTFAVSVDAKPVAIELSGLEAAQEYSAGSREAAGRGGVGDIDAADIAQRLGEIDRLLILDALRVIACTLTGVFMTVVSVLVPTDTTGMT